MNTQPLTDAEKQTLLRLARRAIEFVTAGSPPPRIPPEDLTPALAAEGASFVTLTRGGQLRGCIGALEPYQSLAEDVREHAADAAVNDYRFPPVRAQEVPALHIEISRLTAPQPLEYASPEELPGKLRPGLDGVVLYDGARRATFLPQVWQSLPAPVTFLNQLCQKMGAPASLWRQKMLRVFIYEVEEFEEE